MNYLNRYFFAVAVLAAGSVSAQQSAPKPALTPQQEPVAATTQPAGATNVPLAQAVPDPSQMSTTYVIGADDALSVTVWKEPSFSGAVAVRPDGMIAVPLLGDIPAAGMTPMQLGNDIATRLKKYVNDPLVTVNVTAINSKHIYLLGEVMHVGPQALLASMTPLQAISAAGGLTTYANQKKMYVLRVVNGKQQKIPFNYKTALKTGNMQGVVLQPGDTIVVP